MTMLDPNPQPSNGRSGAGRSSIPSSLIPGSSEQKAIQWAEKEFEKCRKARLQFERVWYTNLAFYFGRQYIQWTPSYGTQAGQYQRLYEPPAPPWRVRLVSNKIKPIIRKEHSKITKEDPQPYVIPSSTDDDDLAKARAAEHIHEFLWRDLKGRRVIRRAALWLVLTGNGFVKDWYDPDQHDSSDLPGKIMMEHVTPFHLFVPDVDEEEVENQPHITHVMSKTPDWVSERFGVDLQPDSLAGGGALEQKFLQALGLEKQSGYNHIAIREMWVKPCSQFKNGAVITWAQDTPLQVYTDGFPFDHSEYPFTKFDHIPTGRFYNDSVITDLIPIQKEYNRTRSQVIEAKNKMSKPQLLAARGSVDVNKITSEPGLVIQYTPGFTPPTPLKLESIPAYVLEELNRCQADMDDISGQHEVSKGSAPPGVTAATAISYLQEQDDTTLSNTTTSLEEGVEKIGKHLLSHVQQFWDLPRTVRVVGTDGEYESFLFSSADITGNTDLNIQSGSAMPRSRAAKQAFIMQLGQLGWIPPDRALRYLDMAETGRLYEEMQIDVRQAQRENLKMLAGQQVLVNTYDEHLVHVAEHNNERKKQRYEQANPQIQQGFEQHVAQHQAAIQANMLKAQQQSAMAQQIGSGQQQGGPPGLPPGGRPGLPPGGHPALGGARPITRPIQMHPLDPSQPPNL